jgi:hypothetical protein
LIFALSIGSALAAREPLNKRKHLLKGIKSICGTGSLTAALTIEQNESIHLDEGKFTSIGSSYELTICESVDNVHSESTYNFASIEQVEQFLTAYTVLRLRDFKLVKELNATVRWIVLRCCC